MNIYEEYTRKQHILNAAIWVGIIAGSTAIGYGSNWKLGLGVGFLTWAIIKAINENS